MKKAIFILIFILVCITIAACLLVSIIASRNNKDAALVYEVNPVKTPELIKVKLQHLDGNGYLKGKYAEVYLSTESELPIDSVFEPDSEMDVYSEDRDFRFPGDEAKLSQANVYYHINRIHDYFADSLRHSFNKAIKCYVLHKPLHVPARYVPLQNDIRFGISSEGINPALDSGCIYSEYSRAVMHDLMPLHDEYESAAISQAYADYFSCSLLDDPQREEYAARFSKKTSRVKGFPLDEIALRGSRGDLDNKKRYPEDLAPEEYNSSEIISGAFWDLRKALGRKIADSMILEAYKKLKDLPDEYFFDSSRAAGPYFSAIYKSIAAVDEETHGGENEKIIRRIFERRGIPEEPYSYTASYKFGSNIQIGWYPFNDDVFRQVRWLGVYRIGEKGRLFGRMPVTYGDLALRLYDKDNELVDNFSTRMKLFQVKDKDYKMFLAEFYIPGSASSGECRFQFDYLDGGTGENQKSNAVSVILVK